MLFLNNYMGICRSKKKDKRKSENKKVEKKFEYEDKDIKFERNHSKEFNSKGEVINEKCDEKIEVKNPKMKFFGAGFLYPRLGKGEDD